MSWADKYTQAENVLGTPHGRKLTRPFPGGQRVGRLPVIANNPFAQQANAQIVTLARYSNSGLAAATARATTVDIRCPSSRLTTCIQLYIERDGVISEAPIPAGAVPLVASLYAMGVNPQTGYSSQMQMLASYNPPAMFQVTPGFRETRLVLPLDDRNFVYSAGFVSGTLKCVATWEPNSEMSSDELNRLQANCSISSPAMVVL